MWKTRAQVNAAEQRGASGARWFPLRSEPVRVVNACPGDRILISPDQEFQPYGKESAIIRV